MKKTNLSLLMFFSLLASCVVTPIEKSHGIPSLEASHAISSKRGSSEASISSSEDYGPNPLGIYLTNDADFIKSIGSNPWRVHDFKPSGSRYLFGPLISLGFNDCWVDVEVTGQKDITSAVKGSNAIVARAYGDYDSGIFCAGRKFPGVSDTWPIYACIPEEACRNPDECFIRMIAHPKENLEAIAGYALVAVFPFGEPVEASSEEADIYTSGSETIEPGLVYLDWKVEVVCDGVSFPKINGEYQSVDINRVNAELDIIEANAKGRYFVKA